MTTRPRKAGIPGSIAILGRRIPEQDAQRIEAWCQQHWFASTRSHDRRAALAVSLGLHGLRVREVINATLFHLRHDGLLYVRTIKRGRPREIQLDPRLAAALRSHAPRPTNDASPLLRNPSGARLAATTFLGFTKRAMAATTTDRYSFHCLRHTAAMRLYEASGDVYAVMHLLGHSSLMQTHKYLARHTAVDARGLPQWHPTPPHRALSIYTPPPTGPRRWWETLWDANAWRLRSDGTPQPHQHAPPKPTREN